MIRFLKHQGLTILWALFIFTMCAIPLSEGGPGFFPGFDKLVHSGFMYLLVVLYLNGILRKQTESRIPYTALIGSFLIVTAFGGLIEILQATVFTWRDGGWDDFFADGVGAGMGAFSILVALNAIKYGKK